MSGCKLSCCEDSVYAVELQVEFCEDRVFNMTGENEDYLAAHNAD